MPTSLDFLNEEHVIVIYEGAAEQAIYELLFKNECLLYKSNNSLIRKSTGTRNAKKFAKEYLEKDYEGIPVNIIRILDSKVEKFKLPKQYSERLENKEIKVHDIVTTPEIEILVILNEDAYSEFSKSKYKNDAAKFCKEVCKYKEIKSKKFITDYFGHIDSLISSIIKYNRFNRSRRFNLYDLLDKDIK